MFRHESHLSRAAWLFAAFALCPVLLAAATGMVAVGRVEFEPTAVVGGRQLPLRGATLCRHLSFKVYTAAFYTAPEVKSAGAILSAKTPRRLVLHYHRDIEPGDIQEATEQTLRANPANKMDALRERLEKLYAVYKTVGDGDRYMMDYTPGVGCELFLNGKSQIKIEGDDFAAAYFGIWLSDYSISGKYRDRLLGKK